jgi:hypothetical protein
LGLCAVNTLGRYAGTGFGAEATTWYAEQFNATGNPIYFVGGSFSALWTPETYLQTALALAAAPYAAAEIAAAGAHSVAAAARVAAKQVVEEVVGAPASFQLKGSSAAKNAAQAERGGLNLFKWNHPTSTTATGWREGDYFLHLPNQGSTKKNWIQNSSRLRTEMRKGNPIFDSFREVATGQQIPTRGFLNAERNLLETHGWRYNPQTGAYYPPGGN